MQSANHPTPEQQPGAGVLLAEAQAVAAGERELSVAPEAPAATAPAEAMTLNEYQKLALRTAPPQDVVCDFPVDSLPSFTDLNHGALGVSTEAGELLDVVKKGIYYNKVIDWVNVKEEIGDILWYLALLCRAANTSLESVAKANIEKLKARYPEKFCQQAAIDRDITTERAILEAKT